MAGVALGGLLHELRQMRVTLGLRSDATVSGVVEEADDAMNTTLSEVTMRPSNGATAVEYSLLYVRGRQVLWLQVPDEVDIMRTLQQRDLRGQRSLRTFRTHKRQDKKRQLRGAGAHAAPGRGPGGCPPARVSALLPAPPPRPLT